MRISGEDIKEELGKEADCHISEGWIHVNFLDKSFNNRL
jgi:hypothetical protein